MELYHACIYFLVPTFLNSTRSFEFVMTWPKSIILNFENRVLKFYCIPVLVQIRNRKQSMHIIYMQTLASPFRLFLACSTSIPTITIRFHILLVSVQGVAGSSSSSKNSTPWLTSDELKQMRVPLISVADHVTIRLYWQWVVGWLTKLDTNDADFKDYQVDQVTHFMDCVKVAWSWSVPF